MKTVRFENGYKVTSRPVFHSVYRDGCLVSKEQKVHVTIGPCGRTETPIFHETWEKC